MRDLFIQDWRWKLFSVLLATSIWFTVHRTLQESVAPTEPGGENTQVYENFPVLIVSAAADVRLFRAAPDVVKVTVSGPPNVMDKLQASQMRAAVDLTDLGTNTATGKTLFRPVEISAPPNVTLVSVEPQKIAVIPPPKS